MPINDAHIIKDSDTVKQAIKAAEQDLADRGRILLRPSGTEPLMRVMVEGVDGVQVRQLAEQLASAVAEVGNNAA